MWYDMIWYDMIWYDMIWYDMIWYDMIWYDMIWYDMIWYDIKNNLICVACNKQPNRVKNEMEIITRQKTDLNQERLFQMFDLIYAGLIPFLCNVILYRIIQSFKTACIIDPH